MYRSHDLEISDLLIGYQCHQLYPDLIYVKFPGLIPRWVYISNLLNPRGH